MTHVVTQSCCNDASCVAACPVNCIHPTPAEAGYAQAEMLYIDARVCIDCGACADVCPVGAIVPDYDLAEEDRIYLDLNARFFQSAAAPTYVPQRPPRNTEAVSAGGGKLRIAIVGSGPAGAFAAEDLLNTDELDVAVDMFERLPVPWGLVRFGVAPDHPKTKEIADLFEQMADDPRFRLLLGIEVGQDIRHSDLQQAYDGVIYATGALSDRKLGIAGEDLSGSCSATEFAAWYNGHPDFADRSFNLDTERAVIIGNGNVSLDVARVLACDVDVLRRTDIADHALEALARSRIREVVVVARRGPAEAAFTTPEFLGLAHSRAFSLDVEMPAASIDAPASSDWTGAYKLEAIRQASARQAEGGRVLRLLFQRSPAEILGVDRVTGIRLVKNRLLHGPDGRIVAVATGEEETLDAGLILRSVGYRGSPVEELPFDDDGGTIPNVAGRVLDPQSGHTLRGIFVAGWIRRGATGSMGSNRKCAREAVAALLEDHRSGRLIRTGVPSERLATAVARSGGLESWRMLDRHERAHGRLSRRPRVKLVDRTEMARVAFGADR